MIAKIKYVWVEGEEGEAIITHPKKSKTEFEDDLREIRDELNLKEESDDFYPCVPTYWAETIKGLQRRGYFAEPYYIIDEYYVDDVFGRTKRTMSIKERVEDIRYEE
jgi:hypothetical protein